MDEGARRNYRARRMKFVWSGGEKCCCCQNISKQMLRILSINLSIHQTLFFGKSQHSEKFGAGVGGLRATIWATGAESLNRRCHFYPQLNAFSTQPNYISGFQVLLFLEKQMPFGWVKDNVSARLDKWTRG